MERVGRAVVLVLAWPVLAVGVLPRRLREGRDHPAAVTRPPALDWPWLWVVATSTVAALAPLGAALAAVLLVLGATPSPVGLVALLAWPTARAAQRQAIERWVASRR